MLCQVFLQILLRTAPLREGVDQSPIAQMQKLRPGSWKSCAPNSMHEEFMPRQADSEVKLLTYLEIHPVVKILSVAAGAPV